MLPLSDGRQRVWIVDGYFSPVVVPTKLERVLTIVRDTIYVGVENGRDYGYELGKEAFLSEADALLEWANRCGAGT